jgi:hypothetical protein
MKSRKSKGEKGGVAKIVFLAAGLALEGYMHGKKPFMDFIVRWPLPLNLLLLKFNSHSLSIFPHRIGFGDG